MCRWMAYSGSPVVVGDLLYKPHHSLIDQSLHSKLGAETTNGDGFGIGWYGVGSEPAQFRSTEPAWNDRNLRSVTEHVTSGMVLAHVRASSGGAIQQTNCHPFRYKSWLWMHNGLIRDFAKVKRDLVLQIDPELYPHVEGSTDSEVFFFLALTYGLHEDARAAVARAVGEIETAGRAHGVEHPIQMTVATSDGERLWAFRYSSEGASRTLYYSSDVETLQHTYPTHRLLAEFGPESRLVVSEPLGDLPGAWHEVPESTSVLVHAGADVMEPFVPAT